jgi:putative flippase GtrA
MSVSGLIHSAGSRATFARFSLTAATVAVIDTGVLYALHAGAHLNVYSARGLSFVAAIGVGYLLNRRFTFHHHGRDRGVVADLARFAAVFASGGLLNYAIFAFVVATGRDAALAPAVDFWLPLIGVGCGGLCGMGFNYLVSSRFVFGES